MLGTQLDSAGFFPIRWASAEPGTTYVRPSQRGVLRVFVPADRDELALYAGSLSTGELRYRGPVPPAAALSQWLRGDFSQLPPRSAAADPAALASAA